VKKLGLLPLLLLAGCSAFDRDWNAAPAASAGTLEGRWEGKWTSDANGHEGALRCIITRHQDSGWEARYYASYTWGIIPFTFEYTIPLTALRDGDAWISRGGAELGCWIAGGWYEYEARASAEEYVASYRSDFDRGVFRMKRVASSK